MIRFFLALLLGFSVVVLPMQTCICAVNPYPPFIQGDGTSHKPTSEQKSWALATTAILNESNGGRHDLLGGFERTPEMIEIQRSSLASSWEIQNRWDLFKTLKWIEEGGHRKGFDEIASKLDKLSENDVAVLRQRIRSDANVGNKVETILKYRKILGEKSIIGWDFARYVALCRQGYLAGYISEDEAWQLIMPAARLLQKTFSSWKDLGKNYLVGREFWSLRQTIEVGQKMQEFYEKLLSDSFSPWNRIPWDTNLESGPDKISSLTRSE